MIKIGFNVELLEGKKICQVERHTEGGTYVIGGTTDANLYITYNYSKFFYSHLDKKHGLKFLNMKKAKNVTEKLRKDVNTLGVERNNNYWKATPGNAGYALSILLKWAQKYPEARFKVK